MYGIASTTYFLGAVAGVVVVCLLGVVCLAMMVALVEAVVGAREHYTPLVNSPARCVLPGLVIGAVVVGQLAAYHHHTHHHPCSYPVV